MNGFDGTAIAIYALGGLGWHFLWRKHIGHDWLREKPSLKVAYFGALFVFAANIALSFFTPMPDYATELNLYPYVEQNAKTIAGLSLAIAIFVFFKYNQEDKVLKTVSSRKFIFLVFSSFLLSVMGCLPLYWMPPKDGWLTVLRHLKTVPLTYSIFILAAAIIIFISETHKIE